MPIFENELILSVKFPPPLKGYCFGGTNVSRENPGNKMRPFTVIQSLCYIKSIVIFKNNIKLCNSV